jgi:hypothetical protein
VGYYVPLGPRGLILQIGTFAIGVIGTFIYWRASVRRAANPMSEMAIESSGV